jgi:hypothetical protein
MQASLVYKFSCARCASEYVGCTSRTLRTRVSEHSGRSFRTGTVLSAPPFSAIREHSEKCNSSVLANQFSILSKAKCYPDVRILESLFIFKLKPVLNNSLSSFPLAIVNR